MRGATALRTPFCGRGGRRELAIAPFERAMVSIVTIALSLTVRMSATLNSTRGGSVWVKILRRGVPFGL